MRPFSHKTDLETKTKNLTVRTKINAIKRKKTNKIARDYAI